VPKKLCSFRRNLNIGKPGSREGRLKSLSSWKLANLFNVKRDNASAIQLSSDASQQQVISMS
jgi:hypothetical protein